MTRKDNKGQRQESIEEYKIEAWKLVNWVQKEKKKNVQEWMEYTDLGIAGDS